MNLFLFPVWPQAKQILPFAVNNSYKILSRTLRILYLFLRFFFFCIFSLQIHLTKDHGVIHMCSLISKLDRSRWDALSWCCGQILFQWQQVTSLWLSYCIIFLKKMLKVFLLWFLIVWQKQLFPEPFLIINSLFYCSSKAIFLLQKSLFLCICIMFIDLDRFLFEN